MLTDTDITKLLTKMGEKFPTLDEYSHMEKRFDELGDRVNELPTRADMEHMLERTYNYFTTPKQKNPAAAGFFFWL